MQVDGGAPGTGAGVSDAWFPPAPGAEAQGRLNEAHQLVEDAAEQAALIIETAERRSEQLVGRARAEADALRRDVADALDQLRAEHDARVRDQRVEADAALVAQSAELDRLIAGRRAEAEAAHAQAVQDVHTLLVAARAEADRMLEVAHTEAAAVARRMRATLTEVLTASIDQLGGEPAPAVGRVVTTISVTDAQSPAVDVRIPHDPVPPAQMRVE